MSLSVKVGRNRVDRLAAGQLPLASSGCCAKLEAVGRRLTGVAGPLSAFSTKDRMKYDPKQLWAPHVRAVRVR